MPNWFTLSLLSVFCIVLHNFFAKKLLDEQLDPRLYGALMQFFVGVIGLVIISMYGLTFSFTTSTVLLLSIVGIIYSIASSLFYSGFAHTQLSKTSILDSSGIFWSLLIGLILFREPLTFEKIIGVLFIFASILILSWNKKTWVKINYHELLILASAVFYAIGAALDKHLLQYSNPLSYMMISFLITGSIMLIINLKRLSSVGIPILKKKSVTQQLLINASLVYIGYLAMMYAYQQGGEVSRVYPIFQTQPILTVLVGIVLLKEKTDISKKLLATILTVGGLLLLWS